MPAENRYREEPDLTNAGWIEGHHRRCGHGSNVCSTQRTSNFILSVIENQWERIFKRMARRRFLRRHGIVRNAIKEDLRYFAIPWVFIMFAGMGVSAWDLVKRQGDLYILSVQSIVGLALVVIGFTILLVAQVTLRRYYSSTLVIREDHQLITHGIYRFTRHPIYLGNIMVFIGVSVFTSSLYGLLIMSALIPIFLNRIRMEERLLTEEFGDAHRTYMEATRKLLPFIF